MGDSLSDTIYDLEDRTWKALSKEGSLLLPYLSNDCIFLFPMGMIVSHESQPSLETVMTSDAFVPWSKYRISRVKVVPVGENGATITYKVHARRPTSDEDDLDQKFAEFKALIASTWKRDSPNGRWLMCVHQQTPYDEAI